MEIKEALAQLGFIVNKIGVYKVVESGTTIFANFIVILGVIPFFIWAKSYFFEKKKKN